MALSSGGGAKDDGSNLCGLCCLSFASYTCPRCHVKYCSLACYKGEAHAPCSETFYKEQFVKELEGKRASSDEKRKMMEMLKRLEEEYAEDDGMGMVEGSESEEEEGEGERGGNVSERGRQHQRNGKQHAPIEERLAGLDLQRNEDLEQVWDRLTAEEQREFASAVASGNVLALVGEWRPWWLPPEAGASGITGHAQGRTGGSTRPLVEELGSDGKTTSGGSASSSSPSSSTSPPSNPVLSVPLLSALLGGKSPAWQLVFNVVEVLFAYSFSNRVSHGALDDLPLESVELLAHVSSVLGMNAVHDSVSKAIRTALACIYDTPHMSAMIPHVSVALKDVELLLGSAAFVERALVHLLVLSTEAKGMKGSKSTPNSTSKAASPVKTSATVAATTTTTINASTKSNVSPGEDGGGVQSTATTSSGAKGMKKSPAAAGAGGSGGGAEAGKVSTQVHRKAVFLVSWCRWVREHGYERAMQTADNTTVTTTASVEEILAMLREMVCEERECYEREQEESRRGKKEKIEVRIGAHEGRVATDVEGGLSGLGGAEQEGVRSPGLTAFDMRIVGENEDATGNGNGGRAKAGRPLIHEL